MINESKNLIRRFKLKGKKSSSFLVGVCLLLLVLMLAVPSMTSCAPAEEESIKIGAIIPMTGKHAEYGPKMLEGIQYAFAEVDNQVAGTPIELVWDDGSADATISLDKARKQATSDKIRLALGPIFGNVVIPVSKYWAEVEIPHIMWHCQTDPAFEGGWTLSNCVTQVTSTYLTGVYLAESGAKTMTAIGADYVSGYNFVGGALMGFEDAGGTVIQKQWAPLGTVDFGPYLAGMEEADCCAFWLPGGMALLFMKQFVEFGLMDKMTLAITSGDTLWDDFLPELGEDLIGVVGATQYTNTIDSPESNSFKEGFYKMFGHYPDTYDCVAYEMAACGIKGLEVSGGKASGQELLDDIKGLDIVLPGGSLQFHSVGYGIRPQHIIRVELVNGQLSRNVIKSYPPIEQSTELRSGVTPGG